MARSDYGDLARLRPARSARASSWDRSGGNDDCIRIEPGATAVLADIEGPGVITHLYFTIIDPDPRDYRDAVLRMFWDDETAPSVEVPFGDFLCVSNCTVRHFTSLMMTINSGVGPIGVNNGFNCYFPMPFATRARIELVNQAPRYFGSAMGRVWYHIDYERHREPPDASTGRFHAQWRRENPTAVVAAPVGDRWSFPRLNATGDDNYVILEAEGHGHVAGLFLQVNNVQGGWYGEGDDMIFIDGEKWPPSIHGTGSEEIFGGGACPDKEYAGPYTGFLLIENEGGDLFKGKNAMYRWYLHDPVRFEQSIRMTIEHGHANDFANDYTSVAYWYQAEPHAPFPALPPLEARRPIMPDAWHAAEDKLGRLTPLMVRHQDEFVFGRAHEPEWMKDVRQSFREGYTHLHAGEYDRADAKFGEAIETAHRNGESI